MENWTHWREFMPNDYLRAECFAPKEKRVLTIKDVKRETITSNTGDTDIKPVAYFEEDVLPMVLNVTNCTTIENLYGTGNIYEWVGKKIQVFATNTKVAGKSVPCLRIDKVVPATKEVTYQCCVCGKTITKELYNASVAKYGKPYCGKECYDKDTNGENLL